MFTILRMKTNAALKPESAIKHKMHIAVVTDVEHIPSFLHFPFMAPRGDFFPFRF